MVSRVPLSRQHKSTQALIDSARPFIDHSIEGLRTKKTLEVVYPSSVKTERAIFSVTETPLASFKCIEWQKERCGDCLHCGDALLQNNGINALPIAKYKVENKFWIFGQFCSPGCSLGYIRESSLGCQVESWTRSMFMTVFGLQDNFKVCPPRFTLKKYGGSMTKLSWEPLDFAIAVEPPLCTFAMFSEACIRSKQSLHEISTSANLKQNVQLKNILRPVERDTEIVEPTSNGREPFLLKLLGKHQPEPVPEVTPKEEDVCENKETIKPPVKKRSKKESTQMLLDCM